MRKKLVFNHTMGSGDFLKIYLVDPPVNDVDDFLIEIKGKHLPDVYRLAIQDWEAILLCKGLTKALVNKYGTIEACIKKLRKKGKLTK